SLVLTINLLKYLTFLMILTPPQTTLFPYTTLFRSCPKTLKICSDGTTTYSLNCENPCTPSKMGRVKQITVHHNYRFNTSMPRDRSEEHTSELQSRENLVCRLLLEKKK